MKEKFNRNVASHHCRQLPREITWSDISDSKNQKQPTKIKYSNMQNHITSNINKRGGVPTNTI